jgi:hypothetical protein
LPCRSRLAVDSSGTTAIVHHGSSEVSRLMGIAAWWLPGMRAPHTSIAERQRVMTV